jgi:hypothetical protein
MIGADESDKPVELHYAQTGNDCEIVLLSLGECQKEALHQCCRLILLCHSQLYGLVGVQQLLYEVDRTFEELPLPLYSVDH